MTHQTHPPDVRRHPTMQGQREEPPDSRGNPDALCRHKVCASIDATQPLNTEMPCRIPVVGDPLCDQRPNGCSRWRSELPLKEAWRVAVVALWEKERVQAIKREQGWVLAANT